MPTTTTSATSTPSLSPKRNGTGFYDSLHVIGLTGGIAAGKSTACSTLEEVGCGIVDADKLGHSAYLPGSDGYYQLIQLFGADQILSENESDITMGNLASNVEEGSDSRDQSVSLPPIDRRKLGAIVFSDKEQMKKLTDTVWPIIAQMARDKISQIDQQNKRITIGDSETNEGRGKSKDASEREIPCRVVIVEAAILLEAGWDTSLVDEVWSLVVPQEIAIQRLQKRNNYSEEEGRKRVQSQMTNEERISKSNVVIDSSGSEEMVKKRVLDEFHVLQSRLTTGRGFSF